VRIVLDERKVFRERLKVPDREVLKVAEETLAAARKLYEGVTPYFTKTSLTARFFHSQERYRKATGLLTSSGHFSISMADYKKKTMEGTLEWHLPGYARTLKDRELSIRGTLCHENAHYLNAIHFARELPQVLEEGIATYVESRLNTEYYQYFRETDRERIEASARNALNAITKYQDFLAMLDAARGFDRGDEMISRWYGLCYAIVDFFEQGEIGGRKGSFVGLLKLLETVVHDRLKAAEKTGKPERREPLAARQVVEMAVANFYRVDLAAFHKALVGHVLAKYRQR
jgi:hypothetical protein